MTIGAYLYWSGVTLNLIAILFIILCIWVWFIWPFVEACSYTRCVVKGLGKDRKAPVWRILAAAYADVLFGRQWTAKSTRYWRWEGVGKWTAWPEAEE